MVFSISPTSTGQVSEPLPKFSFLQIPVFLLNSRHFLFCAIQKYGHPFSLSYRVILPSSFSIIHSSALVYSTNPPVLVLVRFIVSLFFQVL